jgi:hypothetical protein
MRIIAFVDGTVVYCEADKVLGKPTVVLPVFEWRTVGNHWPLQCLLKVKGLTQPPIKWVPGSLSLGVKRPGREVDHSPPSSAEVKEYVELYLHSPNMPSWRGAQLKKA